MVRAGTLLICVHNCDVSGANQAIINILSTSLYPNVVIASPKDGPFVERFLEVGAAVRIGDAKEMVLRGQLSDVFLVICNTLLTADIVLAVGATTLKCLWIVHEFWNKDELEAQLRLRPENGITPACIAEAISSTHATIVFVSELQRDLFQPSGASCVIYLGVEEPAEDEESLAPQEEGCDEDVFTILMLGVVCPRKGQLQMVDVFKKLRDIHTGGRKLRLCCVGARNGRSYEDDYLRDVEEAIGGDPDIHLHGIVDKAVAAAFLQQADCLVVNSSNEVTPLVIAEAFARKVPVVSTQVGGISEMFNNNVEGFFFEGEDELLQVLCLLLRDPALAKEVGIMGYARYLKQFSIQRMVDQYAETILHVAPPLLLIDMDGVLVDWDQGFSEQWCSYFNNNRQLLKEEEEKDEDQVSAAGSRNSSADTFLIGSGEPITLSGYSHQSQFTDEMEPTTWLSLSPRGTHIESKTGDPEKSLDDSSSPSESDVGSTDTANREGIRGLHSKDHAAIQLIDRTASFEIAKCVPENHRATAAAIVNSPHFFYNLPPKDGAIKALKEILASNIRVLICSAPLLSSTYCAQEKLDWVRRHLGPQWVERVTITHNKAGVRGDLLIDDNPDAASGPEYPTAPWRQVLFNAPYNMQVEEKMPRLSHWRHWRETIFPLLGKKTLHHPHS